MSGNDRCVQHGATPYTMPLLRGDRLLWRFTTMLMLIGVAMLLVSGAWMQHSLRQAQQEAFTARFDLLAQRAATVAERTLELGLPLTRGSPLHQLLEREVALEPAASSFSVLSAQGETLLSVSAEGRSTSVDGAARASIRNDLGQAVATVLLRYDDGDARAALQRLAAKVYGAVWPALLLWCVALALLCAALLRRVRAGAGPLALPGGERGVLTATAGVGLGLALLWIGWAAVDAGQAHIQPDQLAKACAVARSSAALMGRALDLGVPASGLVGVGAHAAALHAKSPEIVGLAVRGQDGAWWAGTPPAPGAWTVMEPVHSKAAVGAGELVLTLDAGVLTRRLLLTLVDMAFLSAVCLLLALEGIALGLGSRGARALTAWETRRGRLAGRDRTRPAHGAAAVRPALFLFMLAEELTRPFLPTWARSLAPVDMAWSPSVLASVPLVVFLAVVALLQWPLAAWSEGFGRRRGMVLGGLLGALGLAVAGVGGSYGALVGGRLLGAVGFAMVFVSAQGAVIDASTTRDRARSLALFVQAILVAGLCGPPLGGLVADRWGVPAAFVLAATVALLAAMVAGLQMPGARARRAMAAVPSAPLAQSQVGERPGLASLLLGCALPAKLLLAALCFYLLPMHLQDQGYSNAVVGRLQTVYPLTMVLLVPLAARLVDRWRQRQRWIVLGGLLAGASALQAWHVDGIAALALVLLGLGVGQALSITPQSALVADVARSLPARQGAGVLGLFRLTERGGSALGPVVGAWLLPVLGFGAAVATVGAVVLGGSLVYGWRSHARAAEHGAAPEARR